MSDRFMIYGATGYTGKLTSRMAKEKGLNPILAGRNADKVKAVAEPLGLEWRAIDLADKAALQAGLQDVNAVLHIAGPFSATSAPMADACIATGTHYLDITGEISVFEALAARNAEAQAAGVMLLPGCGFDVVPSDCLAAHMARRMPDAKSLKIFISGMGNASRGTMKTGVESIGTGTKVRRGGKIVNAKPVPEATRDLGAGEKPYIAVSWGDVSTAFHSTNIPDIDIYFEAVGPMKAMGKIPGFLTPVLQSGPVQNFLRKQIDKGPEGPTDEQRAVGEAILMGEVEHADGTVMRSRLRCVEGYTLTYMSGLEIAGRAARGEVPTGFQTPSKAFGPDFIMEFDGSDRQDINS
ncbi:MAG: saccharopine dehydrogenase family protein [Alphaproteobacteria bacterium]